MAEELSTSGFVELKQADLDGIQGLNELNRMLRTLFENIASDTENVRVYRGFGTPESNIAAAVGSLYMRQDGGASTALYVKETGTDTSSGWIAK